jgi:hypothetical protein
VLQNLSENIRECYRHAEDCERLATKQTDPDLRKDFLDTAERWLKLAHSYEFTERLVRFLPSPPPQAREPSDARPETRQTGL